MSVNKALRFSVLDRYSGLVINFIVSVILARLLTPDELGVFSLTMVLLAIVQTMRDMGAGTYIIQEKELTTDRIRAAWTVQLGIGFSIAVLVLALAHPAAIFYDDMRIRGVLVLLALNFAINPIGAITVSLLLRNMEFKKIAIVRFCGAVTGGTVSIGLAVEGYGPASLALGSVATTIISAFLLSCFRPAGLPWRPGLKEVRRVLSVGTKLTGAALVTSVAKAAPEASLGRFQGMVSTGLYARATGLISLFDRLVMDALNNIMLPTFSSLKREGRDPTATFLNAFGILTAIGYSFFLGLAFLADYVILILYGAQWLPAASTAKILCLNAALALPLALTGPLLIAGGRIRKTLTLSTTAALLTISAAAIGATFDLETLAILISAATAISAALWLRAAQEDLSAPFSELVRSGTKSLIIAAITCGPLLLLPPFTAAGIAEAPYQIALTIASSLLAFVVALRVLCPHILSQILRFFGMRTADGNHP